MVGKGAPGQLAVLVALIAAMVFAGCSAERPTATSTGESTSAAPSTAAASKRSSTDAPGPGPGELEVRGDLDGGKLWALVYHHRVGREVKTIWRMTGDGTSFTIHAIGPTGQVLEPVWGPEFHAGSNWDRPGEEWGAGWVIPTAGWWTFKATRGGRTGTVAVKFS